MLCPPVIGQCMVEVMVNPPQGRLALLRRSTSKEYDAIFAGLYKRAHALYDAFQKMEGVSCASPAGSMYLFPSIALPQKAIDGCEEGGQERGRLLLHASA